MSTSSTTRITTTTRTTMATISRATKKRIVAVAKSHALPPTAPTTATSSPTSIDAAVARGFAFLFRVRHCRVRPGHASHWRSCRIENRRRAGGRPKSDEQHLQCGCRRRDQSSLHWQSPCRRNDSGATRSRDRRKFPFQQNLLKPEHHHYHAALGALRERRRLRSKSLTSAVY